MEQSGSVSVFRIGDVRRLIAAARRAAAFPESGPEGWRKSPVDPCAVLAVFGASRLKRGYTLRAYSFREGGNGNAFVHALPVVPAFPDCPRKKDHFLDPPVPPGALDDVMKAIDGDASALSRLSPFAVRSRASRVRSQVGRLRWTTHTIMGGNLAGP